MKSIIRIIINLFKASPKVSRQPSKGYDRAKAKEEAKRTIQEELK
jgi:hypothetical protein